MQISTLMVSASSDGGEIVTTSHRCQQHSSQPARIRLQRACRGWKAPQMQPPILCIPKCYPAAVAGSACEAAPRKQDRAQGWAHSSR